MSEHKDAIEGELGDLDWQDLPDRKACHIAVYREAKLEDQDALPLLYDWLRERAEAFRATFADRLKNIALPELGPAAGSSQPAIDAVHFPHAVA